jgi:hypothetical protein
MRLALYVVKDKIIIPTLAETQAGHREIEPVACLNIADPALPEALEEALKRGNPPAEAPSRLHYPQAVVLKYAGAKSWGKFAAIAERWDLVEEDGAYVLARGKKQSDGSYWGGKEKLTIPIDTTGGHSHIDTIITAILSDATTAKAARHR